jgi:hypothetical protein
VIVKKRVAAVLALAACAAIGVSSSASASGDPLYLNNVKTPLVYLVPGGGGLNVCGHPSPGDQCPAIPLPNQVSVEQLVGPGVGDTACTPANELEIPGPYYTQIWICKQSG